MPKAEVPPSSNIGSVMPHEPSRGRALLTRVAIVVGAGLAAPSAIVLAACSNDSFVGTAKDGEAPEAAGDGDTSEAGSSDGGASEGGATRRVACSGDTCVAHGVCCLSPQKNLACSSPQSCADIGGYAYACDDSNDCGQDQVCCAISGLDKQVTSTQCLPAADCTGARQIACRPGVGACPADAAVCAAGDFLPPYIPFVCQP